MPSGWDVYYIVILAAVLALGIPASLVLLSLLFSGGKKQRFSFFRSAGGSEVAAQLLGKRINTRFFLAINVSLVLIALMLALIPCIASIRQGQHPGVVARTLVLIVTFGGVATLALLHAARKGDLGWLRTFLKDR